jgi:hypothetical protein
MLSSCELSRFAIFSLKKMHFPAEFPVYSSKKQEKVQELAIW